MKAVGWVLGYLVIQFLISCTEENTTWIAAYQINSDSSYSRRFEALSYSETELETMSLEHSVDVISVGEELNRVRKFKIKENHLIANPSISLVRYSDDSVAIKSAINHQNFVYKKIPEAFRGVKIESNDLMNKWFEIKGSFGVDTVEILSDSTFFQPYEVNFTSPWSIHTYNEYFFLVFGNWATGLTLIPQKVQNDKIEFITYYRTKSNLTFKKLKKLREPNLVGRWEEIKRTFSDPDKPPIPSKRNLAITKDSISFGNKFRKWSLSPSNQFIIIHYEYIPFDVRPNRWKIKLTTNDKLIIEQRYSMPEETETIEFRRVTFQ